MRRKRPQPCRPACARALSARIPIQFRRAILPFSKPRPRRRRPRGFARSWRATNPRVFWARRTTGSHGRARNSRERTTPRGNGGKRGPVCQAKSSRSGDSGSRGHAGLCGDSVPASYRALECRPSCGSGRRAGRCQPWTEAAGRSGRATLRGGDPAGCCLPIAAKICLRMLFAINPTAGATTLLPNCR